MMRAAIIGAAFLIAAAFASPVAAQTAAAFGSYAPDAPFAGSVTSSLYLPMRDGVRLAVSVTRPATSDGKSADGRFPVVWTHTLGISAATRNGVDEFATGPRAKGYGGVLGLARLGYVVVQVARRGAGPSFGTRRGYNDRAEAFDAYELIDWLAAQPWSTGAVGVYGCSNTGDAAMHAVTSGNPNLKAAWAGCFSWEKYDGFLRGGVFANWGAGPDRTLEQDMANTPVQGDEAKTLLRQAAEEHQKASPLRSLWPGMPYRDSWSDSTESRFWYEGSVAAYGKQIDRSGTALYIQGGWHDDLRGQGLTTFASVAVDRRIVIGPWTHCGNGDFDLLSEMHRFFDWKLKGLDTGLGRQARIQYYVMNAPEGRAWRGTDVWPVVGTKTTRFFLAQPSRRGASLASAAPRGEGAGATFAVRYDVDCPTVQPGPGGLLTGAPPCPVEHGGPRFDSAPLSADTEVTGDAIADLWVSSTTPDANVFVYLEDVAPDGKATPVTDARLKASLRKVGKPPYANFGLPWHRSHAEDAQPLKAGEPVRMTFAFLPASYVFKAGHRIRISVAGADYRERVRTSPSSVPMLTLHRTSAHPSSVVLPIVGS